MTGTPADPVRVMPSANLFCSDGRYVHLEQDWRRGLGWWLVDGKQRTRLSVADAIRVVPHFLAHEVLLEAELLVPREVHGGNGTPSRTELRRAALDLNKEVASARAAYHDDPQVVGRFASDRLVD